MNQAELIDEIATSLAMSKVQAQRWLQATTTELRTLLQAGESVSIPDWGTFDITVHARHRGFLPHSRRFAILPARRVPVFRPAGGMREDLHDVEPPAQSAVS